MPPSEVIAVEGTVIEALPNEMFRVETTSGQRILAHVASKLRLSHARILPGDRVAIELSPYDGSRGRITYRMK